MLKIYCCCLIIIAVGCGPHKDEKKLYDIKWQTYGHNNLINAEISTSYSIACSSIFGGTTNLSQTGIVVAGGSGSLQVLQGLNCTITLDSFFDGTTTYTPSSSPLVITINQSGTISSSGSLNSPPSYTNGSSNIYLFLASSSSTTLTFEYAYEPTLISTTLVNPCLSSYCSSKPSFSSGSTSFNGISILVGSYIYYSNNLTISGINTQVATNIFITEATASFTSVLTYTVNIPDGVITLSPSVSCGTTIYSQSMWQTTFPTTSISGNTIFGQAAALSVLALLVGVITPVVYQARFYADRPNVIISWQWGAAVYNTNMSSYANLGVKSAKQNDCTYNNTDPAGTPELKKASLTSGATGSGGTQYTGGQTSAINVTPANCVPVCSGSLVRCPTVCQTAPITLQAYRPARSDYHNRPRTK